MLGSLAVPAPGAELQAGALRLQLDSQTGNVNALSVGAMSVPLHTPAAIFHVRDIKVHSDFVPLTGRVLESGGEYVIEASARPLGLTARITFHAAGRMLAYHADIIDTTRHDRGLVVSMTLPLRLAGLEWSGDLYESETVRPGASVWENVTPISAVRGISGNWAIAAEIPPTAPVMYDTHLKDGDFGLYYYVGISSAPRELPSRTWIEGVLYDVDPNWSFRSALQKYYEAYPHFSSAYRARAPGVPPSTQPMRSTRQGVASMKSAGANGEDCRPGKVRGWAGTSPDHRRSGWN